MGKNKHITVALYHPSDTNHQGASDGVTAEGLDGRGDGITVLKGPDGRGDGVIVLRDPDSTDDRETSSSSNGSGVMGNGALIRRDPSRRSAHQFVVLTSAFLVFAINAGFFLSFGVLFGDLLTEFQGSRSETASVNTLFTAVEQCISILIAFFVKKYGARRGGVVGCVLLSAGILMCFLATSLWHVQVLIGAVAGLGFSLFFLSGIDIISQSFEGTNRMTALSMVLTAPSVAGLVYPLMLRYMLDMYGLHWTFLLIGALTLNCIPLTFLWYQLSPANTTPNNHTERQKEANTIQNGVNRTDGKNIDIERIRLITRSVIYSRDGAKNITFAGNRRQTNIGYDSLLSDTNRSVSQYTSSPNTLYPMSLVYLDSAPSQFLTPEFDFGYADLNFPQLKLSTFINVEVAKQLLTNAAYLFYAFGQAFAQTALLMTAVFTVDIVADKGHSSEEASWIILLFNLASVPGRLFLGFVRGKGRPIVKSFTSVVIVTFAGSGFVLALVFGSSSEVLALCFSMIGFSHGCVVSSTSVTVSVLVPPHLYTPAVGSIFSVLGVAIGIAGPLNGTLRDISGSYDVDLFIMFAATLLGSALFFAALYTGACRNHGSPKTTGTA